MDDMSDHSQTEDHDRIQIYTDGACRRKAGEAAGRAAMGIVFLDAREKVIAEHNECLGTLTNNEAEYRAVIRALELATRYCRETIEIFSDSELIIKQLTGKYALKAANLKPLFKLVKERETAFEKVVYKNVPRECRFTRLADALANAALDGDAKPLSLD